MNRKNTLTLLTLIAILAAGCDDPSEDSPADVANSKPAPTTTAAPLNVQTTESTGDVATTASATPRSDATDEPRLNESVEPYYIMVNLATFEAWGTDDLTSAEWEAYQPPSGWIKDNVDNYLVTDSDWIRSPGATEPGPTTKAVHEGVEFEHIVNVLDPSVGLDDDGLLNAARIFKHHNVTYPSADGNWIRLLVDPDGNEYVLINRKSDRTEDIGPVPEGWSHRHVPLEDDLALTFSGEFLNIRDTIGDLYQGPVVLPPELQAESDTPAEPQLFERAKTFHIIVDTATFRSWGTSELDEDEWDEYVPPSGWIKDTDTATVSDSEFIQSPGASEPGPTTKAVHNGIEFEYVVDLLDPPADIDEAGLLNESHILKHHVVTFPGDGNWIRLLIDPDGSEYILINRDPDRTEDIGPVPEGWSHRHVQLDEDLTLSFSGEFNNVRDTIGDLYQGPIDLSAAG